MHTFWIAMRSGAALLVTARDEMQAAAQAARALRMRAADVAVVMWVRSAPGSGRLAPEPI